MIRWGSWAQRVRAASACALITVLAGCSAGTDVSASSSGSSPASVASPASHAARPATPPATPRASTTPTGPTAPLTGLAVTGASAQRPAVAVAVAGPDPVGLQHADLTYAEMTSPVRYLAVFQSQDTSRVGPVTSTRPADGQTLSVLHPLTSYDGGTTGFISVLDATKIVDEGYAGHPSYYSAGPRGLNVSPAALAAAGRSDRPPPGLFLYRAAGTSLASGRETHPTSVRIQIPGQQTEHWSFAASAGRWLETAGGPRVGVANLIVQVVPYKAVYLSHRYDQTTQSARVIGQGQVTVFSGSAAGAASTSAAGTWDKPGIAAVTNYFDSAHVPMSFEPGPTWVVLAPPGTRIIQAGR
jgi:hypothetical protein